MLVVIERGLSVKWFKRLSLVWKITLITISLLIVPVCALCFTYIQTTRASLVEDASAGLEMSLGRMQNQIDSNLEDAENLLEEFFFRQELSYYLNGDNVLTGREMNYFISSVQSELNSIKYLYSNMYSNIGIYSSNKQIDETSYTWLLYMDGLKDKVYYGEVLVEADEAFYGSIRNTDMLSSTLETSNLTMGDSGNEVLPIYRRVKDLNTGELIGIVEVDVDVSRLTGRNTVANVNKEIGNMVLGNDGEVLYDTRMLNEESKRKIVEKIRGQNGTASVKLGKENYSLQYQTCPKTGLVEIALLSNDLTMEGVRDGVLQVVGITFLCVIVLIILTYYLINNMLKRLVVLDQMMGKVGEGDFEVKILDDDMEDEVTRISRSFNKMASQLNSVLEEKVQNEKVQKDAELRALQAQINPHFLYNTLENMRMQCEIDEYYTMSNSLSTLSELFRYSIRWNANAVPFELEWQNLKNYLVIMEMRYEDEVECELECDHSAEEIVVPKLILQPLVENSFNHGFKGKLPPWKIVVSAKRQDDALVIVVEDNGIGIDAQRLEHIRQCMKENKTFREEGRHRTSIGVLNVKQRIEMLCKEGSGLWMFSEESKGTRIEIKIRL